MQKSLSPAEAANVVAECRKVPHVKNALFEYTKHEACASFGVRLRVRVRARANPYPNPNPNPDEVRAFLRYVRNANGLEEGADITFGVLSKAIEAEHDYRIEQLQEAQASLVLKKKRGTPLQRHP